MMNTNKYSRNHRLHNLLIPVCLVFVLLLTASFRKESVASTSREHNDFVIVQENGKETPPSSYSAISSEDKLLGFIMKNIVYPKEALENNFGGEFDFAVKFTDKGVDKPTNKQELTSVFKNAKRLDEIVIVGYQKNVEKKANSDHKMLVDALYDEVWRVLKSFKETKDLVGKSFVLHLKFTIANTNPSVKEMVNEKSHQNKNEVIVDKQQIRNIIGENKRPTFILNEEKIITENEMENINPESIESVNVIKGETYENKKLGTIKGDVIIIKLK